MLLPPYEQRRAPTLAALIWLSQDHHGLISLEHGLDCDHVEISTPFLPDPIRAVEDLGLPPVPTQPHDVQVVLQLALHFRLVDELLPERDLCQMLAEPLPRMLVVNGKERTPPAPGFGGLP